MTATARSKRTFTVGSVVLATLLGFASTSKSFKTTYDIFKLFHKALFFADFIIP